MPNTKVLVTGSTNGQFRELFAKAKQLHEKYGPFEVHLCVGDFFGPNLDHEVLEDLIVPLTTYFITGESPFPERVSNVIKETDGEVCSNLYSLGKRGYLQTSQGIKIAFLSGTYQTDLTDNNQYTENDIEKLCQTKTPAASPPGFDILMTHEWPQNISDPSLAIKDASKTSLHASRVAAALKPRYHFAASQDTFYEREPYKNIVSGLAGPDEREAKHATRFIGLGDVLNKNKQRWFYAFNLVPMTEMTSEALESEPNNTTENPFTSLVTNKRKNDEEDTFFWGEKRSRNENEQKPRYICKICNIPGHNIRDCPEKKPRRYEQPSLC
ncbi:hypothetical protein G6F56_009019 [Rhizopus delemar]|nr:hypothetical protein G6F56_009019 [Rhizopus delemar]